MNQEQNKKHPLDDSIDQIKDLDKKIQESGDENLKNDPSYQLYHHIYQTTTRIFDDEETKKVYDQVAEILGKEASLGLMSLMILAMTHSAYDAVAYYNNYMSTIMDEQFTAIIDHINGTNADIEGIKAAITVFRKQLNDLQSKVMVDKFAKDNGVDPGK